MRLGIEVPLSMVVIFQSKSDPEEEGFERFIEEGFEKDKAICSMGTVRATRADPV
ncbi:hypothetical protein [Acetobacter persici]|uniref:hypothetical protein n=1 Tax=Acetobacter persici TaxID=1076596 RepID=UPI001A7E979F|nr:hypothetical protein [Acetobacter persici]MCG0998452.1 hypothetical protein [Acetobacter persici]